MSLHGLRVYRIVTAALVTAAVLTSPLAARADGTVRGECRFERIKGHPGDYVTLYEWNNYLSANNGFVDGQSYRCGHEFGGGTYRFDSAAGAYTMYVSQPTFFARPKVVDPFTITNAQTTWINPELAIDYSCYVTSHWTDWSPVWYQTFVATGTSINRIQWRLAGHDPDTDIIATVHQDNGGGITTWPQIGPAKSTAAGLGDGWTGYRSGDIPTLPGLKYAIKLTGTGQGGNSFAVMSRNPGDNDYLLGQAYDQYGGGRPNDDLNITVFSDNDGTVIPYCKTTPGLGSLAHWEGYWGQTFVATGNGLAAADLWFASDNWNIKLRFRVYAGGPGGTQIGPSKVAQGASQTATVGLVGASWAPGEVPLVAGNTYYIEMMIAGGAVGFTPYRFDNAADVYASGRAYAAGGAQPSTDLSMTIMEYAPLGPPPEIELTPAALEPEVELHLNHPDQTFAVRNVGGGVLNYQISDNVSWLQVDPASGLSVDEPDTITVHYNTDGVSLGSHTGIITVTDPNADNSPENLYVYLTVKPPQYAPCDYEPDGDVDGEDFGHLQACLTGGGIHITDTACLDADLDGDEDADRSDVTLFIGCMSGPDVPADTLCAD